MGISYHRLGKVTLLPALADTDIDGRTHNNGLKLPTLFPAMASCGS